MLAGRHQAVTVPGTCVCMRFPCSRSPPSLAPLPAADSGYVQVGGKCISCPDGCDTCTPARVCLKCSESYFLAGGKCQEVRGGGCGAGACSRTQLRDAPGLLHTRCRASHASFGPTVWALQRSWFTPWCAPSTARGSPQAHRPVAPSLPRSAPEAARSATAGRCAPSATPCRSPTAGAPAASIPAATPPPAQATLVRCLDWPARGAGLTGGGLGPSLQPAGLIQHVRLLHGGASVPGVARPGQQAQPGLPAVRAPRCSPLLPAPLPRQASAASAGRKGTALTLPPAAASRWVAPRRPLRQRQRLRRAAATASPRRSWAATTPGAAGGGGLRCTLLLCWAASRHRVGEGCQAGGLPVATPCCACPSSACLARQRRPLPARSLQVPLDGLPPRQLQGRGVSTQLRRIPGP